MARVAGIIFVKIQGVQRDVIGNWTVNPGGVKREMVLGADRIHGYKEMPKVAFIEGEIRDQEDLSVEDLQNIVDQTITVEFANEKVFTLREGTYVADGDIGTEEANIQVRFEGISGEYT